MTQPARWSTSRSATLLVSLHLLTILQAAAAKSVVAFAMVGATSHHAGFGRVGLELMERGHDFALLVSDKDVLTRSRFAKDPFKTVKLISFEGPEDVGNEVWLRETERDIQKMAAQVLHNGRRVAQSLLSDNATIATLRAEKFDVVIRDMLWWPSRLLSEILEVPDIDMGSYGIAQPILETRSMAPNPLAYQPQLMLGIHPGMGFRFRFYNYLQYLLMRYVVMRASPAPQREISEAFGYKSDGSFLPRAVTPVTILGSDWAIEYPQPVPPTVHLVGPFMAFPGKPLPEDLESFLTHRPASAAAASNAQALPAIYVSLGTCVRTTEAELRGMVASLAALKLPVLWKLSSPELPGNWTVESLQLPAHIRRTSWAPQNDILAHEALGAFVTHGGANSVYEAAYHGKPIVSIPFQVDQVDNAAKAEYHGYGATVKPKQMEAAHKQELRHAVETVLQDPTFKANAIKVQKRLRKSRTPAQQAADIIEHVLDTDCEGYLHTREHLYPWWQLAMLDVKLLLLAMAAAALSIVMGLLWAVARLLTWALWKCNRKSKHKAS